MNQQKILVNFRSNGVVVITLNRPDKYNALDSDMYHDLTKTLNDLTEMNDINLVIVTGSGKYYSSGNDMRSIFQEFNNNITNTDIDSIVFSKFNQVQEFIDVLINFPKLLIAIVNGPAIGIAVSSLALFDIVYAVENATFQTPFSKVGLCAESCSSYLFPRIFGKSKATEMLNFNYKMSAEEALSYKFISKIIQIEDFDKIVSEFEQQSTQLSTFSFQANKFLVRHFNINKLHQVNALETEYLKKCYKSGQFISNILQLFSNKV